MSRFKILALIALFTFALGLVLVGDALAGEKMKVRHSYYAVKFEPVMFGDEEGHMLAIYEGKGLTTNLQGKKFLDGWWVRECGLNDIKGKALDTYSVHGYSEFTDGDGDKIYTAWEGKKMADEAGKGTTTLIKGTGKWQGIQGRGTWISSPFVDGRWYADHQLDVELPR